MSRIVHLSDLHFGTDRQELLLPLADHVRVLGPDLVVVSGDLTQRARRGQFAEARTFLDGLGLPWLAVPGNHDVPLHNPLMRLLRPYSHYRAAMGEELEPARRLPDALVSGLNTVDPYVWQRGRLRRQSLERACAQPSDGVLHLVAMHHPPEHAPGVDKRRMRGAEIGLAALWECGVDVVLCGHLHSWRVQPVRTAEGVLLIQAGTEELLFRGYIQQALAARFSSPLVWMVLPSALFALGHYLPAEAGQNALPIALWSGIFGVLMADLTARAGTLGPAIAVHLVNNVSALLIVSLPDTLSGLSLFTVPYSMSDAEALRGWLAIDFATMFVCWLAARLALRR